MEHQNLVEIRENYCADHSNVPSREILDQIAEHTYSDHERPHLISGHLQGAFLSFLSKLIKPRRVLEIGTFTAYSTVCLASGLHKDGEIVSLEKDVRLRETISINLEKAALSDRCTMIYGDAEVSLAEMKGKFDLIFVDAAKKKYKEYTEMCLDLLEEDGLIIIDNVLFKNDVIDPPKKSKICKSINQFNKWLDKLSGIHQVMLPMRDGITLLRKDDTL